MAALRGTKGLISSDGRDECFESFYLDLLLSLESFSLIHQIWGYFEVMGDN